MITEDYCSFELSKLLKEKGFDGKCIGCYWDSKETFDINYELLSYSDGDLRDEVILAPTHQMAMKWLRERHVIIVIVPAYFNSEQCVSWDIDIWADDNYEHLFDDYSTYEEAVEVALKYAFENLI